ncbi:MAG: biotin--[acetyl-CoA-carboxylase] ligase [Ruminococcaceae bacterium]|nr:biotin--[acetyl-CoA-carboxylase] ligase [Oscillospiraceae bacterium]
MKDFFNLQTLRRTCAFLPEDRIFFYEKCDSTNTAAKKWAKDGNRGAALFAAAAQTAGRGRMGRSFFSPPKSGVYFTLVKTLDRPENPVGATCAAAVAVLQAIFEICGVTCEIKWVNDLFYQGKKVCGILTESVVCGNQTAMLIGVGVNLRPAIFPPELAEIAGSLGDEKTPRVDLIAGICKRLLSFLKAPSSEKWIDDYRRYSCVLGRKITFQREGIVTEGTALEITVDGGLLVRTASGEEILRTGEITLRTI